MTRIRYVNNGTYLVTKQQYILPTGQVVVGHINLEVISAKIVEENRDMQHWSGGSYKSVKHAKTALKQALTALGVDFSTEVRKKKTEATEAIVNENPEG